MTHLRRTRAVLVGVLLASPASGQSPLLDSLVKAHSLSLELSSGTLRGPGADFILNEAAASQFVALGEQHNALEIPRFVTALFRELQTRAGFRYLADEQDPVTGRHVSQANSRGNADSVAAIARRYPHAFTFMSDQELTMLADVGRISSGLGNPIWGCDQVFGATHVLDALLALPQSKESHDFIVALRDSANAKERRRDLEVYHYMSQEPKTAAFARLRDLVRPRSGSEADFLVQSLVVSDRIFRNHEDSVHRYESGYEREEYMKARFLEEYQHATAVDRAMPRAILKFGHWHVFRGLGPSNLQTLGDFVSQFAVANGSRSFHIAIFPNNPAGGYGDMRAVSDTTPFWLSGGSGPAGWTVVDLRALRPYYPRLAAAMSPPQQDLFRRWIFGFDAALLIRDMHPATYALNPGVKY